MLVLYIILGLIVLFIYILLGRLAEKILHKVGFEGGPLANHLVIAWWPVVIIVCIFVCILVAICTYFYKRAKLIIG